MKIQKIGHCCLVIETEGKRIMTDPGAWSEGQENITGLHALLITHEHSDHLHVPSVQAILKNNPGIRIITNTSVRKLLDAEGIVYEVVEDAQKTDIEGITILGCGNEHSEIYGTFGAVQNTGYHIGEKLYYPGDSFCIPPQSIEILALPVCGPWMRIREAIDFAKTIKPKVCFPVHDGMLKIQGPFHSVPSKLLAEEGIQFIPMNSGDEKDF